MIVFILIVFGLATIRTIIPLADPKNFNLPTISLALLTIGAFGLLCNEFLQIK